MAHLIVIDLEEGSPETGNVNMPVRDRADAEIRLKSLAYEFMGGLPLYADLYAEFCNHPDDSMFSVSNVVNSAMVVFIFCA